MSWLGGMLLGGFLFGGGTHTTEVVVHNPKPARPKHKPKKYTEFYYDTMGHEIDPVLDYCKWCNQGSDAIAFYHWKPCISVRRTREVWR